MGGEAGAIKVVAYDSNWTQMFVEEAGKIVLALEEEIVDIHHIGSTSIPFMPAKPIIDILPVVHSLEVAEEYDRAMESLGYESKGEFGMARRRFYSKDNDGTLTFHVHVFEKGDPEIERHVGFRDFLISNSEDARAYAQLKQRLARRFPNDPESYTNAKSAFIQQTESRIEEWRNRFEGS